MAGATVTIGANTYKVLAPIAFADEYLAGDVMRAAPWATRNNDAKARGMVSATRKLVTLPWVTPIDLDADDQVEVIKEAASMLASDMLSKPKIAGSAPGASNLKSVKAGSAQVEFFSPVDAKSPLPDDIWALLVASGLMGSTISDGSNEGAFVSGAGCCRPFDGRYDDCVDGYGIKDFG